MSSRLRVVSFNIRHGASAVNRLDLSRTLEVIRGTEADVVALQEVDRRFGERSGYEDQPGRLAEGLSMDALYAPAITLPAPSGRAEPREYGVALLSKLPLEPLELPVQDRRPSPIPL
ncbi:endonuclease/exonuclease/phosphatase family protein [Brachybacterium sp. Marseille-Q7125]|uniref:endonuclease/exonuclease/phosphatase family protein n=1 Tax=Brachybacterium sp. Marseille-Q7125 TaxID=2932815 RepID=UPI001FF41AD1|nr:endonuclease/exonuclease/phosphatase family protein [Brachybacterium sp. Marseille-Q7125]